MTKNQINALNRFFQTLRGELTIDLAIALADKLDTTDNEIFRVYESWQIS